jgi:subtilase family serine protease
VWNAASFNEQVAQRQCVEFLKLSLQGVTVIATTGDLGAADQTGQYLDPVTGQPTPQKDFLVPRFQPVTG